MASPKLAPDNSRREAKGAKLVSANALMADELGSLEKEMAPFAQKLARIEELRKALRAACPAPADIPWTCMGTKFVAMLGPQAMQRTISFGGVVKAIGAKAYAAFATCTLKALEENCEPAVVAAVVSSGATGPRSLKTYEKGSA
jgi:hypothetical protein